MKALKSILLIFVLAALIIPAVAMRPAGESKTKDPHSHIDGKTLCYNVERSCG